MNSRSLPILGGSCFWPWRGAPMGDRLPTGFGGGDDSPWNMQSCWIWYFIFLELPQLEPEQCSPSILVGFDMKMTVYHPTHLQGADRYYYPCFTGCPDTWSVNIITSPMWILGRSRLKESRAKFRIFSIEVSWCSSLIIYGQGEKLMQKYILFSMATFSTKGRRKEKFLWVLLRRFISSGTALVAKLKIKITFSQFFLSARKIVFFCPKINKYIWRGKNLYVCSPLYRVCSDDLYIILKNWDCSPGF